MAVKNRSAETLKKTADEISTSVSRLEKSVSAAADAIAASKGTVVIISSGKLGKIADKISADFRSAGKVSYCLDPSSLLHGEAATISGKDVVILISSGSEREETISLVPMLKRIKPFIITLTPAGRGSLSKISNIVIPLSSPIDNADALLAYSSSVSALSISGMICLSLLYRKEADRKTSTPIYDDSGDAIYTVQDLVSSGAKTPSVPSDTAFRDALFELTSRGLGAISVTGEDGKLAGIITDGDVRRLLQKSQGSLARIFLTNVESLMTKNPKRITSDMTPQEALRIMENSAITVLPVVNAKDAPVGMIHLHDLVQLNLGAGTPAGKASKKKGASGGKKRGK